ncbi:hypothetical protein WA158_005428 [Blastocystis sp. Blastoise]
MLPLDIHQESRSQRFSTVMYFKRLLNIHQMDLEYTYSQLVQLVMNPTQVYKMTSWRKQTKNQWSRDDPSFTMIVVIFTLIISSAYSICFHGFVLSSFLKTIIQSLLCIIFFGALVATATWYIMNSFFRRQLPHSPIQSVEWMYSYDIHFNACFPFLLVFGVIQYFLLPIITKPTFFATLIANFIILASFGIYWFITFMGYLYLPFIYNPEVLFLPFLVLAVIIILCTVFKTNLTLFWIHYFL